MKKARLLLAVVFAAVAVSMSACVDSITASDICVDPGGNSYICD